MKENEAFDLWNEKKKSLQINNIRQNIYFKQGDVWWCHLGKNIGTESYGKGENFRRPILVYKKLSSDSCIAIPLSTQQKQGTWFCEITLQEKKRWALLYQVRMIHSKRFTVKLGELDEKDFLLVKQKLGALLELS